MKLSKWSTIAVLMGTSILCASVQAQDVPGMSVGAFFERRTDNKIGSDELSFSFYGVRLATRDARWIDGFVDLGLQGLDFGSYKADDAGCFGLGGTLWFLRSDDTMLPLDIGVYGSYHTASYTLTSLSGADTDARYGWYLAQGVVRGEAMNGVCPYVKAGVMGSKLDPNDTSVLSNEHLDAVKLAVNVGVQITLESKVAITVEGNYSEGVGGSAHLDYWF